MAGVTRADERMYWVMQQTIAFGRRGFLVAWGMEIVDDFITAFPESEKTVRYYSMGPHSCPMLNRAARRARDLGFFESGHVGNMDARSFNQRTWCRCWTLTDKGRTVLLRQKKNQS